MNSRDLIQLLIYLGALAVLTPLFGEFLARVLWHEERPCPRGLARIDGWLLRCIGTSGAEMSWREFLGALAAFNGLGIALLVALQMAQAWLPLNPAKLPNVPFALALNTAVSFVTNTNWQAYSGESTMSYLTQMSGLGVQNFVSAGTGLAAALALIRGLTRRTAQTVGNFWADLTRSTVYVLLPLSLAFALVLVSQGVPQTFAPYAEAKTLEGAAQQIPLGPAAAQIAIKQLGTNGGGYFGVNSAHPFENPTPFSNFLESLAILLLASALVYAFGRMVRDRRQGLILLGVMAALFLGGFVIAWQAELQPNPVTGLAAQWEGKEQRFGMMNSVLWAVATTDASSGSVNAMHDSLSPLAGLITMVNMQLGEVIFGGLGAGLYGMLMFVLLTVFIAGLMVGRTPEYLGKKIEAHEVRWAVVAVLAPCATILLGTAATLLYPEALKSLNNAGPHGLSELLYAYTSAAANNGSAFAGISVNTDWYNYTLALAMFIGRFAIIGPVLAIAGSLAAKKYSPPSAGTFPTHRATFGVLLTSVVLIVGALTFFPTLALGPVVEHFLMQAGRSF